MSIYRRTSATSAFSVLIGQAMKHSKLLTIFPDSLLSGIDEPTFKMYLYRGSEYEGCELVIKTLEGEMHVS